MTAYRRFEPWSPEEDAQVLAYVPHTGLTLRDVAAELGRTYFACRRRRKDLLAGRVEAAGAHECARCRAPLPEGRQHGYCEKCKGDASRANQRSYYQRNREATLPAASRNRRRWQPGEDARLLAGALTVAVARELQRTLAACQDRRLVLTHRIQEHGHDQRDCGAA